MAKSPGLKPPRRSSALLVAVAALKSADPVEMLGSSPAWNDESPYRMVIWSGAPPAPAAICTGAIWKLNTRAGVVSVALTMHPMFGAVARPKP
jgi:hypothetical protein